MNTIVDTTPPSAPQLPRIEPTDILRAAGHMGIRTAGPALATGSTVARHRPTGATGSAGTARAAGLPRIASTAVAATT